MCIYLHELKDQVHTTFDDDLNFNNFNHRLSNAHIPKSKPNIAEYNKCKIR